MSKSALFVEGQAEQIFVRELLLRRFNWMSSSIGIRCYQLIADQFESAEYDYGDDDAEHFYQLINVGNDNKVLSAMFTRANRMYDIGFERIIGLRDMYSLSYRELSPNKVNQELNQQFIEISQKQIIDKGFNGKMELHFAIMEVEAWMLALLDKWKGEIKDEDIRNYFDKKTNIESIYHPFVIIKKITTHTGNPYEKHKEQVNSIISGISWDDFQNLYHSNRCPSFNRFLDSILPNEV